MVNLSKSKYCALWQCPKMAWLKKYKPEERTVDDSTLARMEAGNEIGDLAMGLFGDYTEVTAYDGDRLDLPAMLRATKAEMEKGTAVVCEASFVYNGLYCAVDILRRDGDGWALYEVKSSSDTADPKDVYIADIAYQKYVLTHCGVKLTGLYLIRLNHNYVFDGQLRLEELFAIDDVTGLIPQQEGLIEANLSLAERLLASPDEPDIDLSGCCNKPYRCAFWDYCSRALPRPSVFDLYRLPFEKKIAYYRRGLAGLPELFRSGEIRNEKQCRQMDYALRDLPPYVERESIRDFLSRLSYPLYFLDFETMQPIIPRFAGTRPYQQIPFQYSLHYIETEGGVLQHREFLAQSGPDPRRALAEQLCRDIPWDSCVTAYNKSFECSRLKELAACFTDLSVHLLNICDNVVDLLVPFQSGYYYNRAMGGSFSIKSVLPAICPDDPALDYHALEGVHNGSEAMSIFPKIQFMPEAEKEVARKNLLKYCELDTLAMVKVWEELKRVSIERTEKQ